MSDVPEQTFVVIDVETTGLSPTTDKIVEFCAFGPNFIQASLINPTQDIPASVSAIHHITNSDVKDSPTWEVFLPQVKQTLEAWGAKYLVAHNAKFDQSFVGLSEYPWICTYKCALRQWPDAPTHSNEGLKYWLKLDRCGRSFSQQSHTALGDCLTTAAILHELLKYQTPETLLAWTSSPRELLKMPFGRYKGLKFTVIGADYLNWLITQPNMDEAVLAAAKKELATRE